MASVLPSLENTHRRRQLSRKKVILPFLLPFLLIHLVFPGHLLYEGGLHSFKLTGTHFILVHTSF